MKTPKQNFFHYTSIHCLKSILQSGMIIPNNDPTNVTAGLSATWVSSMDPWDPICCATLELAPNDWEYLKAGIVPGYPFEAVRIQVDNTVTQPWDALLSKSGTTIIRIFRLAQVGYEYDSDPEQWRASPNPISCRFWIKIQIWDGEEWITLPRHGELYKTADLDNFISRNPGIKEFIDEIFAEANLGEY